MTQLLEDIIEGSKFKTTTNPESKDRPWGYTYGIWSILNAVTLVTMTIITIAVHVSDVEPGIPCISTATCDLAGSGKYRAMNFTAESTSVSYRARVAGGVRGIDNTMQEIALNGWPMRMYADDGTNTHLSSRCAAINTGRDVAARDRCVAEGISVMYELPNGRESMTLTGGVHIVYMFFVTLHISASFALIMLPDNLNMMKMVVIPLWHIMGVLLMVLIYTKDTMFEMRVPVNNVILAVTLELFTLFIQYMWTVDHSQIPDDIVPTAIMTPGDDNEYTYDDNPDKSGFNSSANSSLNTSKTSGGKLKDLMRIQPLNNRTLSYQHTNLARNGKPVYNACLLYTSPSPRDQRGYRMPSSA